MLRLLLPPNLAAAAPRNAIMVRLELDLSAAPPPELVPALAILQRLGVKPQPVSFLQLTRAQLRELLAALTGRRVFFRTDRPADALAWNGLELPGVSEHLVEKPAPPPRPVPGAQPAKPAAPEHDNTPMTVDGSEHYLAITLPSRDSVLHEPALEFLRANRFVLDPLTRKWWLRDRHKVLNILATHWTELRERYRAEFSPNFERNTAHLRTAEIAASVSEQADGYDVSLGLAAGGATEAQIREAVATGRGYIEDGKTVYLVDAARLAKLEAAQRALAGEPAATALGRHRVAKARAAEVTDLLEDIAPHFQAPETWHARSAALRDLRVLAPAPVPAEFAAMLRPYQRLGVAWLWYLYGQELGGILADEMGLGKTPQALALLAAVTATRTPAAARPHLAVVPASLMENWRREAARFTPHLRVFVHHGTRRLAAKDFAGYDLVLTSYGTLSRDAELFAAVHFDVILADEAQHLRNRRTQAAQSLRALHGRGRFLLTGTPLENSPDDLRSLFEFLLPGFLPRLPAGLKREEREWHDERLRVQTAPYLLRRTKAAVAPELPEKIEQVVYCELTDAQAALYRRMQEDSERELIDFAAKGTSESSLRFAVLTQLLRLRQICCDPRLVSDANGRAASPHAAKAEARTATKAGAGDPALQPYPGSAKLDAFRELLAESIDEGHRMLVFSQFTSLLALLREELDAQNTPHCYLDGSMSAKARQAAVDRFQNSDDIPVFLISLKAGGTGLNLTGADVVVHYDPWWNPAVEAQAASRAHRIGQTKVVTSYRLICAGTVEEKVLALQDSKRKLLADVFEASDAAAARLSLADLRSLLA
jgi:superfamily II DNA or RNA helicase